MKFKIIGNTFKSYNGRLLHGYKPTQNPRTGAIEISGSPPGRQYPTTFSLDIDIVPRDDEAKAAVEALDLGRHAEWLARVTEERNRQNAINTARDRENEIKRQEQVRLETLRNAAPYLLAALEVLLKQTDEGRVYPDTLINASIAIAKARGE